LFLNALFEAQCTTGAGPGGGGDTDGDGVDDASDPFPDDPNKCGDSDGDGCDDCSGGTYDLANDCEASGGASSGGCCETSTDSGARHLAIALLVGLLMLRSRRRPTV
jgi:MYXO-CTERM domain-containing protein